MKLAVFFLIYSALLAMFGVNITTILRAGREFNRKSAEKLRRREDEAVKKAGGMAARYRLMLISILKNSAFDAGVDGLLRMKVLLALLGLAVGILIGNPFLAIVLLAGLFWIPDAYFRIVSVRYTREADEVIETAMSVVTNSYMQSEDIKSAIIENLPRIDHPLREVFREFLAETGFVDASVINALKRMKMKADNSYFDDWCDILIQCQDDRDLKYALPSVVSKLSNIKRIQVELDTKMLDIYKEFLSVVAIVALNIPLMFVINREWADILFHSQIGKITVAVCFVVIFISSAYVVSVNKPLTRI